MIKLGNGEYLGTDVIILDNTGSEGIYKNAQNGMRMLNGQHINPSKQNLTRLYARCFAKKGADTAAAMLLSVKADTANYSLSENDMNNLGYALLEDKLVRQALRVFHLNCTLFPLSDNAWNSYGEALEQNGQQKDAEKMYEKSLQLNPANEDSKKAVEKLRSKR